MTGTHTGDHLGVGPTGQSVQTSVSHFLRTRDDQITERWPVIDTYRIHAKIGAIPGVGPDFQQLPGVPAAADGIFVEWLGTPFDAPRAGRTISRDEARAVGRRLHDGAISTGVAAEVDALADTYRQNTGTPPGRSVLVPAAVGSWSLYLERHDLTSRERTMVSTTAVESNVEIVREYTRRVFNGHDPDLAPEYVTPGVKWHGGTLGTVEGAENLVGLLQGFIGALPDLNAQEQDIVAQGDAVAVRFVVEATHQGNLLGIAPTGRRVRWDAVDVYRLTDGKISEEWAADDLTAILHQVGAYTPPWLA